MDQQERDYALVRQVPEMERGFAIATNYGRLNVPPGPLAERIQLLVRLHLERERAQCARLAAYRAQHSVAGTGAAL